MRFLWPDSIVVLNICGKYAVELLLMQDDQVVETLTPYTSEKSFTDGIRSRGVTRSFKNFNVTRLRNSREALSTPAQFCARIILTAHLSYLSPLKTI
jgi:hypothetical protein